MNATIITKVKYFRYLELRRQSNTYFTEQTNCQIGVTEGAYRGSANAPKTKEGLEVTEGDTKSPGQR